jgi:dihydrofolate reductase
MTLSLIVAHGNNFELGLNNKLLWNIPEDLKNFKEITNGHHMIMGRKTYESIGRPLPNRTSLILTRTDYDTSGYDNLHAFNNIQDAINFAEKAGDDECFIIGGAEIYNRYFYDADKLYISEVDYNGPADAFLKQFNTNNYELISSEHHIKTETTPAWDFKIYHKIN